MTEEGGDLLTRRTDYGESQKGGIAGQADRLGQDHQAKWHAGESGESEVLRAVCKGGGCACEAEWRSGEE